ncbi:MAG: UpxY family transcription antiterminator [Bacteroidales bacterium]|nr:UpxY family transcription antiterminator [Bacteroidales bacterium]
MEHFKEEETPQWFVLNAYKSENKAEQLLIKEGIKYFIPKHYVLRKSLGKTIRRLEPFIPNLVFVYDTYYRIDVLQKLNPFIWFATRKIQGNNVIMKVPEQEMNNFIAVAKHYEEDLIWYKVDEIKLKQGSKVRITGGIFNGAEGTLQKIKGKRNKRLVVQIKGLVAVAATYIQPDFIQVIEE